VGDAIAHLNVFFHENEFQFHFLLDSDFPAWLEFTPVSENDFHFHPQGCT